MKASLLIYIWKPDRFMEDRTPHVVVIKGQGEWTLCGRKIVATDLVSTYPSSVIAAPDFCQECATKFAAEKLADD